MSALWTLPFILMLLAIAVLPLTATHWWERNLNKFWVCLALGLPVLLYLTIYFPSGTELLGHTTVEYLSFIILLASLYVISGGIFLEGDIRATPFNNTCFLLVGSVLASLMGTTGAAMVLIRPLLNTNAERKHVQHTVVYFIFLVANIGGCLTPIGDPPLFMGYLFGVPFTWTLRFWQPWLWTVGLVLLTYYIFDTLMYRREPESALTLDRSEVYRLSLRGQINLVFLAASVACVAFVTSSPAREILLVLLSAASLLWTPGTIRRDNAFSWGPIVEVAVLFFGIFLTMIPAIYLLKTDGATLGVTEAWQFFWATGLLSGFLDNTPTYVTFFNLAQSLGLENEIVGMPALLLEAISLGAVFFGAMTYIGNAPNFMVKTIAEERKIRMPSFFGFMLYSGAALLPVFLLNTWLWFTP